MTEQMTAQEIAQELENHQLLTNVKYWKRLNTVTVDFDQDASTAAQVEAELEEIGFKLGYNSARYDAQRINPNPISQADKDQAAANFRSSVGTEYLRK